MQGPREKQLTYKVGQGRDLPERAGFPGRGGGRRGWWVASEDEGRRVWAGRGDSRSTGSTPDTRTYNPTALVCGQQAQGKLGSPGRLCLNWAGEASVQPSGCSSNICAVYIVCKVGLQAGLERQAELLHRQRCPL